MLVRAFAVAMLVIVAITGAASADPVRVPLLLVDAPATFDTARFATSLETYVTNAAVESTPRARAADDVVCADAIAVARDATSPVALWARWSAGSMAVSMVTVDKGCAAIESSTVDIPPEQPDFVYRVAALKIASLLRVLPEVAPDPVVDTPAHRTPLSWSDGPVIVNRPTYYGAVEVGATGVASTESAARTFAVVASAWVKTRFYPTYRMQPSTRFSVGATLLASASHDADAAGGSGNARLFGASLGGRAILVRGDRAALVGQLDVGVLSVWSSAERTTGASAMSETVWAPVVSVAPHVRLKISDPLHVTAGPTLDVSRSIDLRLGDTALYHASWLRFRWDIRAQLWF